MVTRFISKGKGKTRKAIPISPRKKKGVSVRSVSLEPQAIQKINKKTIKTLNTGESANFSSSLNKLVISSRLKRDKNWNVIRDDRTNFFHGGKAYNVDFDEGLGIISVDERYQDKDNVWHTGRNVFFAQGEDGAQIARDAGGYYINTIMDYLDSVGALE